MQSWPALENSARSAPSTARPTFASPSTIIAFLPPSSIEAPMRLWPACSATRRPVAVLPVNIMKSTPSMSGVPSSDPAPVTTCTRPGGRPASSSVATPHRVEYGVWRSGLMTTPLPAASAGTASEMLSVSG